MPQINQSKGLYGLFLRRIKEIRYNSKSEIIPFPLVFQKLCVSFSMPKKECWEILFLLRDMNFIEIVPYHGIKIN